MYPTTTTGRALTIVYSIIGIPLFLIILTDFGKLFTRCIKFVWSFVRRVYYTGSCRQVRKTAHVQVSSFKINSNFGVNLLLFVKLGYSKRSSNDVRNSNI